jgi:hypothetical protein
MQINELQAMAGCAAESLDFLPLYSCSMSVFHLQDTQDLILLVSKPRERERERVSFLTHHHIFRPFFLPHTPVTLKNPKKSKQTSQIQPLGANVWRM